MATLAYTGTDSKVFTPVSSAVGSLSNGPGTILVLVKTTTFSPQDFAGLTNSSRSTFYHALDANPANTLGDDDDTGSVVASTTYSGNTTSWWLLSCDWASTSAQEGFNWRDQTSLGAWTNNLSTGNAPAAKAGPGTGGWLNLGYCGDYSTGAKSLAVVAIWNKRFASSDYGDFRKTSDLYNHSIGQPIFLCELTATTPVDLIGGSTYSSANSSGTALTGGDPDNWTFDGVGGGATLTTGFIPTRMPLGV